MALAVIILSWVTLPWWAALILTIMVVSDL